MKYRIAIPSYQRYEKLGEKTLNTLKLHNIDKTIIDIFVADEDEYDKYNKLYPEYNIIIGVPGMKNIREFIFLKYYNEGDFIISIDDDISMFKMKNPRDWEISCFCDNELILKNEIEKAFIECIKSNRHMWGINCMDNHLYLRNTITYDYKFCIGHFWGCIIKKEYLSLGVDQYEDYERSIKHYLGDGGVVRLNYICAKTNYISNGGMGKIRKFEESLDYLINKYKNLVSIKNKKSGKNPFLKDKRINL